MEQEVELKLQAALPEEWEAICRFVLSLDHVVKTGSLKMEARYFDTADGDLRRYKIAYRARKENEKWTATVKGHGLGEGGLHRRLEWNFSVENGAPDLSVLAKTTLDPKIFGAFKRKTPVEIVRTDFTRTFVLVKLNETLFEVALDQGVVRGGGKESPILEVEIELKEGRAKEILRLGAELSKRFCLVAEPKSKFLRGLILAGKIIPEEAKEASGAGICPAIAQIAALVRREWLGKEAVAAEEYEGPLAAVLKSVKVTKEEEFNLTSWRGCREDEKVARQKAMLSTLLFLWSEQNVL